MRVILENSMKEKIDKAIKDAQDNGRKIKVIELNSEEFVELVHNDCPYLLGMLTTRTFPKGEGFCLYGGVSIKEVQ